MGPEVELSGYFYPRPLRGGRREGKLTAYTRGEFLSTPSARRATLIDESEVPVEVISIHALCEEGDRCDGRSVRGSQISIHALCEEGDRGAAQRNRMEEYFYPRPLRGGRRYQLFHSFAFDGFLSTPSARRATAKTETKSLFSNKLYNILHEFRRALIYNGSKSYPNHAK